MCGLDYNPLDDLDLALRHIPASDEVDGLFEKPTEHAKARELLIETAIEGGIWGKAEWYYFAGDHGLSQDVADQLWFWFHPDEYDGDLYETTRVEAGLNPQYGSE